MPLTRVSLSLFRPVVRAVDWVPFAGVAVAAVGLAVATGGDVRPFNLAATVRLTALLLGATAGFALLDPAAAATAATPVPRWIRQWTRTLVAFGASLAVWAVAFTVLAVRSAKGAQLGTGGYLLEACVCVAAGLAVTAVLARSRGADRSIAMTGAAVLFALAAATLFYPGRVWPLPGEPDWAPVHLAWLVVLPLPVLVLAHANRDTRR
ncbi:hypothetical protein JOD54_002464 [Actinokineospora baliensis]|uniref:hypothetical protein n=1 Tax=Actinokineospora baliensis TaxID=547056 RepID=UPI00195E105F|nr:hypothetical protein [Actinokineospora baliensis]MBM7772260.1 hypothetical protein [Actinokineospora baliensis]